MPQFLNQHLFTKISNDFFNLNFCMLQGIEQPEQDNGLRKLQLQELAKLNGTLREDLMPRFVNINFTFLNWMVKNKFMFETFFCIFW